MISAEEGAVLAAREARDSKGKDVIVIDLRGISVVTDFFVICSGDSDIQVQSIARNIKEKLIEAGIEFLRMEGYADAHWVLLDFGDIVVHVFHQETREFFGLERLWGDAPRVEFDAV